MAERQDFGVEVQSQRIRVLWRVPVALRENSWRNRIVVDKSAGNAGDVGHGRFKSKCRDFSTLLFTIARLKTRRYWAG